jgi:hypothetical protein
MNSGVWGSGSALFGELTSQLLARWSADTQHRELKLRYIFYAVSSALMIKI